MFQNIIIFDQLILIETILRMKAFLNKLQITVIPVSAFGLAADSSY